jgi:hypothetical protein
LLPDGGGGCSSSSCGGVGGGDGGGGGGTNSVMSSLQVAPATVGTFMGCANTIFISILELFLGPPHSGSNNYSNSFLRKSLLLYFFLSFVRSYANYLHGSNHGLRTGTCNWQFVHTHLLTPMCLFIGRGNSIELYCTETRRPQTR